MATNPVEHINGQIKRKSSCVTNGVPCQNAFALNIAPKAYGNKPMMNDLTRTTAGSPSAEVVPAQHDIDFGSPAPAHANCG